MITSLFDFKIASFASLDQVVKEEVEIADIVEIRQHLPGGIYHSRAMMWRGNLSGVISPLDFIRSKKERKVLEENIAEFERMNMDIRVERMTVELYEEFRTVYQQTTLAKERAVSYDMEEQIKGKIIIDKPVYLVGLFERDTKALVSGLVFSVNNKKEALVSFGAKKKFEKLRGGVGGVFEYYLADFCLKNEITEISHGKSENPCGITNSAGIFEFKARYGFSAFPTEYWLTTFLLKPEKVAISDMIFVTGGPDGLKYVVLTKGQDLTIGNKYVTREVQDVEVRDLAVTAQDHQSALAKMISVGNP